MPRGQYRRAPRPDAPKPQVHAETVAETELPPVIQRPEPRPEMRSARDAAARAAELMETVDFGQSEDKFKLPEGIEPDGWEYEWKTAQVLGREETMHQMHNSQTGWEPVPADRHPGLMPNGYHGAVNRDGMVLMERPKIINDRVRRLEHERAVAQVQGRAEALQEAGAGKFEREAKGHGSLVNLRTEYGPPMAIPE